MLALLFLLLSFGVGCLFILRFFPSMVDFQRNENPTFPSWMVFIPASFFAGTLISIWTTYLLAAFFAHFSNTPLTIANSVVFILLLTCLLAFKKPFSLQKPTRYDAIFSLVVLTICIFLTLISFYKVENTLLIGAQVWSDFGPHLSMIRSFSYGFNFPTVYQHFFADSIRYHFMFQFLAGNFEFLGLPLNWAFNIPSFLSLTGFFMLLYALALSLTHSRAVAVLAVSFYFFRSSLAFFTYFQGKKIAGLGDFFNALVSNDIFIGGTEHESWGLWNQNVFLNQRHLAFGMGIMLFSVICFLPWIRKETTYVRSWTRPIALGVLIGLSGFLNGATALSTLLILGGMFLFARARLEFIVTALIALCLILLEVRFFMGAGASSTAFQFGFIAPDKSFSGVSAYYFELLGILPILLLATLLWTKGPLLIFSLAALLPFIFANTVKITTEITANHKFISISIALVGIAVAAFLVSLWRQRQLWIKSVVVVLIFLLTCTGVQDLITVIRLNWSFGIRGYRVADDTPLQRWLLQNTHPRDVFLSNWDVLNPILLAGRRLYFGWPYFAWSAGYEEKGRDTRWRSMYTARDPQILRYLVASEGIDYIFVQDDYANNTEFKDFNEGTIKAAFPLVFEDKETHARIYRVKKTEDKELRVGVLAK